MAPYFAKAKLFRENGVVTILKSCPTSNPLGNNQEQPLTIESVLVMLKIRKQGDLQPKLSHISSEITWVELQELP